MIFRGNDKIRRAKSFVKYVEMRQDFVPYGQEKLISAYTANNSKG